MDLPTLRLEPRTSRSSNGDVELVSEKRALLISLPKSVFWPLINITEAIADVNRGFRGWLISHTVRQSSVGS